MGGERTATGEEVMKKTIASLTTSGVLILVVFLLSRWVLGASHYHSGERVLAFNVLGTSSLLEIAWCVVAAIIAVVRWKQTSLAFRVILVVNGGLATLLLWNAVRT